jgi:hypothetical protein
MKRVALRGSSALRWGDEKAEHSGRTGLDISVLTSDAARSAG